MRTTLLIAALLLTGCEESDTAAPSTPGVETSISSQNLAGDVTLTSTLLNGQAEEMTLSLNPVEAGLDVNGSVRLRMLDSEGEESPNLVGLGRTFLVPVPGTFDSLDQALTVDREFAYQERFDVRDDLPPGTAFVIDTFGGQDFLAFVVDRSLRVEGRCTDRATVTLDLEPIDGFQ